jgi:D-glycero-alpha-D-manno-heptose-7-phosphate kinase
MIITKTPFRISFFGGGTDYPSWYKNNGGAVISTTIDKYCWITCRELPPFFEHRSRITYSLIENVKEIDEIRHPSARECLRFLRVRRGVEIHHDGDLPARTGLGSSSSFTAGLLRALYAFKGKMVSARQLALDAIHVEQNMIQENVGSQDQIAAAFGGFNYIEFSGEDNFRVEPITVSYERLAGLEDRLMLFYTGLARFASEIAAEQISNIPKRRNELASIRQIVEEARKVLLNNWEPRAFGELLHEGWELKKTLSTRISSPEIDEMYVRARAAGAIGGKLLGAGGGGFVLLYVEPEDQSRVRDSLSEYLNVPFRFENLGSQVVFYQPYFSRRDEGA